MKLRTRWKRVYNPIIGMRFFDGAKYSLGFFTIEKLWQCKEFLEHAETADGSHWFNREMMQVKTDTGRVYKMPFCPWYEMYFGEKSIGELYDENPYMSKKKIKR